MDTTTAVAVSMYKDGLAVAAITEATGLTQEQLGAAVAATDAPVTVRDQLSADPAGALIAWGLSHANARMQRLAEQARTALADLQQAQRREAVVSAAEDRVQRAKEQLHAAEKALRAAKGAPTRLAGGSAPRLDRAEGARIRAWARENGRQVGTAGVIPRQVVEAYYAVHPRAAAA